MVSSGFAYGTAKAMDYSSRAPRAREIGRVWRSISGNFFFERSIQRGR
jgi:hypothetical protein